MTQAEILKKRDDIIKKHCENMVPGSTVPDTDKYKDNWAIRVSCEAMFDAAIQLMLEREKKLREALTCECGDAVEWTGERWVPVIGANCERCRALAEVPPWTEK